MDEHGVNDEFGLDDPGPSSRNTLAVSTEVKVPDELHALVKPNLVKKSSKDPNRGLYPKGMTSQPGPSFCKASELQNVDRLNFNSRDSALNRSSHDDRLNKQPVFQKKSTQRLLRKRKDPIAEKESESVSNNSSEDAANGSQNKGNKRTKTCRVTSNNCHTIFEYFQTGMKEPIPGQPKLEYDACEEDFTEELMEFEKVSDKVASGSPKNSSTFERNESYYFGLFGSTSKCEETGPNVFEWIPVSVVENIFCLVPFLDMMKFRLVCKSWKGVIDNGNFMKWKKAYYVYKVKKTKDACLEESVRHKSIGEADIANCLLSSVKFLSSAFHRQAPSSVMSDLEKAPNFDLSQQVLLERLKPELDNDELNLWSTVATLVILSETTEDISGLLNCLIYPGSPLEANTVLDAFYCILTILYFFQVNYRINHGFHYRLYHVLYGFENSNPTSISSDAQRVKIPDEIPGQQCMLKYCQPTKQRLTFEQIRILNHRLAPNQIVKVIAFAGTGKTTTLIHYARMYPQLKFLNVMFNKSVCLHAKKVFPFNVQCRTAHSLAYENVGKYYRHKLCFKLKAHDISVLVTVPKELKLHHYVFSKLVLDTIAKFTCSADPEISISHVPATYTLERGARISLPRPEVYELSTDKKLAVCMEACNIWKKMIDKEDSKTKIVHDTYLKLYQLSHPVFTAYDCIMIDEAQDADAAMLDIMLTQRLPIILVGDPHQQIYGFRGANNALDKIGGTHIYYLTKSFRFGPEIAYTASCCLEILKSYSKETLVGSNKPSYIDGSVVKGQYAIIARTNCTLFDEAVRLCCTKTRYGEEPGQIQGAFAGGISSYNFDQLVDIYRLTVGGSELANIKDRFIKNFQSILALQTYARMAEDVDLLGKLEIVKEKHDKICEYVYAIKKTCSYPLESANVVFSTAHKSKGLEFDTVRLADDFSVGNAPRRPSLRVTPEFTIEHLPHIPRTSQSDEFNTLYVALTRARTSLFISEALNKVLIAANEKFEYPVSAKSLLRDSPSLKCVCCDDTFIPHTALVLKRKERALSNLRKIIGGPMCMKCATKPKFMPEVYREPVIIFLDSVDDIHHQSLVNFVGPLPGEPPIVHRSQNIDQEHMEMIFEVQYPRLRIAVVRH